MLLLFIAKLRNRTVSDVSVYPTKSVVGVSPHIYVRCLEVIVDLKLNFQNPIHSVEEKISKATVIMYKMKSVLPQKALPTFLSEIVLKN